MRRSDRGARQYCNPHPAPAGAPGGERLQEADHQPASCAGDDVAVCGATAIGSCACNTTAPPNNPTDASAKNSLRDFAMLPPLRHRVLARVPHISNITRVRIAKLRGRRRRNRSQYGFITPTRKCFSLVVSDLAVFLYCVTLD